MNTISSAEFVIKLKQDPSLRLLDVRTPAEYQSLHISGAKLHPLQQLDVAKIKQDFCGDPQSNNNPLYLLCKSGGRAKKAAETLINALDIPIIVVEGGTDACVLQGAPITEGKQSISLQRQVQIAAGSISLIGILGGAFVHPGLYAIAGFVSVGLIFAGISNTCGMALLLAKMPWNQ